MPCLLGLNLYLLAAVITRRATHTGRSVETSKCDKCDVGFQLQVRVTQPAQLVVILQFLITLATRKLIPRVAFFPNQTQLRKEASHALVSCHVWSGLRCILTT